jgi:hypothetical protein
MPLTAADVETVVGATTATLAEARDADWAAQAGSMDWTCRLPGRPRVADWQWGAQPSG